MLIVWNFFCFLLCSPTIYTPTGKNDCCTAATLGTRTKVVRPPRHTREKTSCPGHPRYEVPGHPDRAEAGQSRETGHPGVQDPGHPNTVERRGRSPGTRTTKALGSRTTEAPGIRTRPSQSANSLLPPGTRTQRGPGTRTPVCGYFIGGTFFRRYEESVGVKCIWKSLSPPTP